jgi:hypothetical protein
MTYHYFNCPTNFGNASAMCQSMRGFLTSYTSAAEQHDVESWFIQKVGPGAVGSSHGWEQSCSACNAAQRPRDTLCARTEH